MTLITYNALIVGSAIEDRIRLRQMAESHSSFGEITLVRDLDQAYEKILGLNRCDILFLTTEFKEKELSQMLQETKRLPQAGNLAVIQIRPHHSYQESNSEYCPNFSSTGAIDAILYEPFSIESINEILSLVETVKTDRAQVRAKTSIELLVLEAIELIDKFAYNKRSHPNRIPVQRTLLEKFHGVIAELDEESFAWYLEICVNRFSDAPIAKVFSRLSYQRASGKKKDWNYEEIPTSELAPPPVASWSDRKALLLAKRKKRGGPTV